jgi:hypothetical protein
VEWIKIVCAHYERVFHRFGSPEFVACGLARQDEETYGFGAEPVVKLKPRTTAAPFTISTTNVL